MVYPQNFENKIDFATVRSMLEKKCLGPLGVKCCQAMRFSSNFGTVQKLLQQTDEFLSIIVSGKEFPFNGYQDLTEQLKSIKVYGAYMTTDELFGLQRSLATIADIATFFKNATINDAPAYPRLSELTASMLTFPQIITRIDGVVDKYGNIKDNASPELLNLKRALASATQSVNSIMRRILARSREEGIIDSDAAPSVRDGRLVIPVAPMNKRKIRGIVHDESATGKTIFIEPAEIVEANNNIRELENEVQREIIRILVEVSDFIRPHIDDLLDSYATLGIIDFVRAKAAFAHEIGGNMPVLEREPQVEYYHAVHPTLLLSLRSQGKEVVPLDITLDNRNHILLISGPNAGGKSVCLKTVSIVQYMTQCGLLPPVYSNSHIGIFKNLFIDIGDEQSIENDLSTYSSHLTNMKYFMNNGQGDTLVLIDEFGGGTEPQIGGAIAQAILKRLNDRHIFGVITTHYQNLKHFAEDTNGLINGAMLYDRRNMRPLFQLSIGYPGSSFAIEIARNIGLPTEVIKDAEEIVGSDYINMDKYLLDIARDKKYWENKRAEIHNRNKRLQQLEAQYESELERLGNEQKSIIKEAREEARQILSQSNATIERTIHEIRRSQAEKEQTKELRRQIDELKSQLESEEIKLPDLSQGSNLKRRRKAQTEPVQKEVQQEPVAVGDYAVLDGGSTPCKVLEVSGNMATVAMGNFQSRVAINRLRKVNAPTAASQSRPAASTVAMSNDIRRRQLEFSPDIDVRGMRADEAIQAVTYFIDDAIQFNAKQVRILHGTGNGILRQRIREYLNTVNGVKSYRDEHVQFGGAGITVVTLD